MMKRIVRLMAIGALLVGVSAAHAQRPKLSDAEQAIEKKLMGLRALSDTDRAVVTKDLALEIRALPAGEMKRNLAMGLANVSTEGDFGRDTLQDVTDTLTLASKETPPTGRNGEVPYEYMELADLATYEHMKVDLASAEYDAALAKVKSIEAERRKADFSLTDMSGHTWTLSALKGKVVLVNFWATWCPPCRKEMPDMETLYTKFKDQDFVVLAISAEKAPVVSAFIAKNGYDFPVLLDTDNSINKKYSVEGIPKSFVYNRRGKLVATAIDMRTQSQMLSLLAKAGLK